MRLPYTCLGSHDSFSFNLSFVEKDQVIPVVQQPTDQLYSLIRSQEKTKDILTFLSKVKPIRWLQTT